MAEEGPTGRRAWLRSLLPKPDEALQAARILAAEAAEAPPVRRRPPGAVEERAFLQRCTLCMDCVDACPHKAIHTLIDTVPIGPGTPVMLPQQRPCAMCEGWPCAAACGEGALVVPEGRTWKLGAVRVDKGRCLPFLGPECGACGGLCPEGAPALRLRLSQPWIDVAVCVGCGLCIEACPVTPPALELIPL